MDYAQQRESKPGRLPLADQQIRRSDAGFFCHTTPMERTYEMGTICDVPDCEVGPLFGGEKK
jgi:hypothetical protein